MKLKIQTFFTTLSNLPQRWLRFIALSLAVCLTTVSLVVLTPSPATATQTVILKYGPQELAIPVNELEQFAETGDASRVIKFLTGVAGVDREVFRNVLTQKIPANIRLLDKALNFIVGELFLYEIGQTIYPPSRRREIEALRSSLVLSASDDRQVSLLEVIQKYPTRRVYVDARQLNKAYGQVEFLVSGAEKGVMFLRETLGDLLC